MPFFKRIWAFSRRETVLCIAAACALVSACVVPPGAEYLGYFDLRVLCLLFCLMAVVAGLQECNLFWVLANRLLSGRMNLRALMLTLVLLPFFSSMFVTNDVALIAFVPFAILVLKLVRRERLLPWIVALQTIAANLGSMATPVGNPQNLFIFAKYAPQAGNFFAVVLPVTFVSLVAVSAAALASDRGTAEVVFEEKAQIGSKKLLAMFLFLFALCLISVFRAVHYLVPTAAVLLGCLTFSRRTLAKVDYCLLLTFVFFFVFSGNVGRIGVIRDFLTKTLASDALLTSALASQVVSNVPAAVLLSGFTQDWRALLLGVDIGGLGTPVASLASLISLKLYARSRDAKVGRYLALFTAANAALLALLLPLGYLLLRALGG
ncbi:MAG TPA: SLC13 family permease [Clostridia bacterium]|nr:SLC13 family permease [Clostridia bacterium]